MTGVVQCHLMEIWSGRGVLFVLIRLLCFGNPRVTKQDRYINYGPRKRDNVSYGRYQLGIKFTLDHDMGVGVGWVLSSLFLILLLVLIISYPSISNH